MAARPDPLVASGGRPTTSRAPTETTDQPVPRHAVAGEDRQDLLQIGRIGQGQDALLLLGRQAGMSENITYVITAHLGHVTPIRLWVGRGRAIAAPLTVSSVGRYGDASAAAPSKRNKSARPPATPTQNASESLESRHRANENANTNATTNSPTMIAMNMTATAVVELNATIRSTPKLTAKLSRQLRTPTKALATLCSWRST